jgi:hypothetical protein
MVIMNSYMDGSDSMSYQRELSSLAGLLRVPMLKGRFRTEMNTKRIGQRL